MCGLLHSTRVTVPLILTGFSKSYSAIAEWWATSGATNHMNTAKAIVPFFIGSPDIVHWRQGPTPAARDPDTRLGFTHPRLGMAAGALRPPPLPYPPHLPYFTRLSHFGQTRCASGMSYCL